MTTGNLPIPANQVTENGSPFDRDRVLGARSSRRKVISRAVAGGLGIRPVTRAVLAQTNSAPVLSFASWAHVEPATRRNMQRTLRLFEQIYGVGVKSVGLPFGATVNKLQAWAGTSDMPDVMQLTGNWPHMLAQLGLLAELDDFRKSDSALFEDSFPEALAAGTYQGKLFAVPFTVAPLGLWYSGAAMDRISRKLMDPPIKTIDELDQTMEELRGELPEDEYPIRVDVGANEYAVTRFWHWIWAHGGNPMREDGQGNLTIDWTDPGTLAAFNWLQRTANKNYLLPSETGWWDRQFFAYGKIGFLLDGPYLTSHISTYNAHFSTRDIISQSFRVALPPAARDGSPPVTVADFHLLAIAKTTQHEDLAWKLIRFLTTNELAIRTFLIPQGGLLPVKGDITGEEYGASYDDPIGTEFINSIAPAMRLPPYDGPRYNQAANLIAPAMQRIALKKDASVEQELTQLDIEVKRIYEHDGSD